MIKVLIIFIILTIGMPVAAQVSTDAVPTESGVQQGRVLLDSDINEDEGSQSVQIINSSTKEEKEEISIPSSKSSPDGDPDQPFISGQMPNNSNEIKSGDSIESAVPELTGIDNEDIGVTGSKISPSQIKVIILAPSAEDESGFISDGKAYVRSGFVKLEDIKGESIDESSSEENVEASVKIEKVRTAESKEISVAAVSKTADKSAPKLLEALCSGLHATCEPQGAVTPDTLEDFAQRTANSFRSVDEIRMDDTKIEMVGTQPFKLFGFISMRMKQTVTVSIEQDSFGRVKVQFPWYHFLGRKDVQRDDLKANLEKGISTTQVSKWEVAEFDATKPESTSRPTETLTFNFSEVRAQILKTMSDTLVSYNESDLNFISR